jgi:hypothetical protein
VHPVWLALLLILSLHEALRVVGRRYGYQVVRLPHDMTLFVRRPIAKTRLALMKMLLANDHLAEIMFALKRKWSLSAKDNVKIRDLIDKPKAGVNDE